MLSDPDASLSTIHWDFGDGQSAEGPTVSHVFTQPGSFLVQAYLEREGSTPLVRDVYVQVDPPRDTYPTNDPESEGEL